MSAYQKEWLQDQADQIAAVQSAFEKIGRKHDRAHHAPFDDDTEVVLKLTMAELAALKFFGAAHMP